MALHVSQALGRSWPRPLEWDGLTQDAAGWVQTLELIDPPDDRVRLAVSFGAGRKPDDLELT